jgi:probable phosphoglycerate mutase
MKELYIIRHGETDFNKQGIVQGRGVNSDLNEIGLLQAAKFYKAYHHIEFDKIYTSTLKRTHQTVAKFIDKNIPWQQLAGLDELDWGIYEGKLSSVTDRNDFAKLTKNWMNGNLEMKFPNGENPIEVMQRQQEAMQTILSEKEHQSILICMHGRALRILLCHLLGKALNQMDTFPHSNVSLYRIIYKNEQFELVDFNNLDHLHV